MRSVGQRNHPDAIARAQHDEDPGTGYSIEGPRDCVRVRDELVCMRCPPHRDGCTRDGKRIEKRTTQVVYISGLRISCLHMG